MKRTFNLFSLFMILILITSLAFGAMPVTNAHALSGTVDAPAPGPLYVVNMGNDTVSRANLDGTGGVSLGNLGGTLDGPVGIALDVAHDQMYVVNMGNDTVSRANLDGTGGVSLGNLGGTLDAPVGIALDVAHDQMYVVNLSTSTVSRAKLDGTDGVSLGNLGGALIGPVGIALDMAHDQMYVVNMGNDTVSRANLDGTGGVSLGNLGGTLNGPFGIALDVAHAQMYVASSDYHTVSRANLDGTGGINLGDLGGTLNRPFGIALDVAHAQMYVASHDIHTVSRANLDGTGGVSLGNLDGALNGPSGIALALPAPEIEVLDDTTGIPDGSGTVDFGTTSIGIPVTKAFRVFNTGDADLTLTEPISVPSGFGVEMSFSRTTVPPFESTDFVLRLETAAAGDFSGEVSFGNNDGDENPFNFTVHGLASGGTRLFGVSGNLETGSTSTLVELDPVTGQLLDTIGNVGYQVNGLDYDPVSGLLYATTSDSDPTFANGLLAIEPVTGAGTPIGSGFGFQDIVTDVRADAEGDLFAWARYNSELVTIDPVAGTASMLGISGLTGPSYGMSFDADGTLYFVSGNGMIYTINTTTGAATDSGIVVGTGQMAQRGDFNPDSNKYWGIDTLEGRIANLLVVEISTGAIEQILPTVSYLHSVAFMPGPSASTHILTLSKAGTGSGTVTSSPAGIDCGADCDEAYPADTIVTLSTAAGAASTFTGWSGDPDCLDGSVTMQSDTACTANFAAALPPGPFSKSSPANGATNQPINVTLSWGASSGAASYEYCYDITNDSACTTWIDNGSATSVALSGLNNATRYYWHVRAVNAGGMSYSNASATAFRSFTTVVSMPGSFSKSSPANAAANQPINLTLSWGASSGATRYDYCYDTTNDNACSTWVSNGQSISVTLTGLSYGTRYYWHVRAVNAGGTRYSNGTETAFPYFTTIIAAPGVFSKSSPLNGAANQPLNATLSWQASSGATRYDYCYDATNDSACSTWISNGQSTSVTLSGLSYGTRYYWHVRAYNAGGTRYSNGAETAFRYFNTIVGLPGVFSKVSPTNAAANQPINLTLSWGASTGAASYEYCYDPTNDGACSTWMDNGTTTSVALSGLTNGTRYYWHVRAINASGTRYSNGSATAFRYFNTAP